jgi:hypothetical protein
MGESTGLPIRTHGAPRATSREVEAVREKWLAALRRRVEDGTYFTDARVECAIRRLVASVECDLPERS